MSSLRGLAVVAIALGSVWRIDAQAVSKPEFVDQLKN